MYINYIRPIVIDDQLLCKKNCFGTINSDRRLNVELTESVPPDPHFVKDATFLIFI
jgi:hypothetical protein